MYFKINKIRKPQARLIKKKRDKTQIINIRDETGDITISYTDIKRITMEYYG